MFNAKVLNVITEGLGWYGMAAVFGAYAMTTLGYISPTGLMSTSLNLTGAIGLIVVTVKHKAWPSAVLNILWTVIGLVSVAKLMM